MPIGTVYPRLGWELRSESGQSTDDGELGVRGSQRFDGYLDPVDHISRSGPEPLSEQSYHRTDDRVRLESALLLHLRRLDPQPKVRGYRVELGEIEAVLSGQDGEGYKGMFASIPLQV
ncbi:MAG: hypothetical protein QG671_4343 [Actinomycetota bacterium]|nr:hypothetical protein [Actinomycetota bacterium]